MAATYHSAGIVQTRPAGVVKSGADLPLAVAKEAKTA